MDDLDELTTRLAVMEKNQERLLADIRTGKVREIPYARLHAEYFFHADDLTSNDWFHEWAHEHGINFHYETNGQMFVENHTVKFDPST